MTDEPEVTGTEPVAEGNALEALFPDTPTIDKPVPKPDAHRGRINGVALATFDSGATAIQIALTSIDEGFDDQHSIFLPAGFVADIKVDPNTLPVGEADAEGVVRGNQRGQYARTVRNSKGDAELQVLFNIAAKQGRTATTVPTNIAELTETMNQVLSGVEVVFTRAADKNPANPQYADRLRVRRIADPETASNPKYYRKLRKAWLGE